MNEKKVRTSKLYRKVNLASDTNRQAHNLLINLLLAKGRIQLNKEMFAYLSDEQMTLQFQYYQNGEYNNILSMLSKLLPEVVET
jgi:hypothetical protein